MNLESLERAKEKIKRKIAKGSLPRPEDLEAELKEDEELRRFALTWYQKLYEFDFWEKAPEAGERVEERLFHSPTNIQLRGGPETFEDADLTEEDFQLALEIMALKAGAEWNYAFPFASFDLVLKGRRYRASLLHHSLCKEHGSKLFLRGHSLDTFELESFGNRAGLIKSLVQERKNILVSGSTASGKTSLLSSMLNHSDPREHLLILEDAYEIVSPHENSTRLLARQGRPDDLSEFMANAMRMCPDRIVVGELRSKEVEPFLLAMNSGHRGLLGSIHANSAADAVARAALLVQLYSKNPLDYNLVCKLVCRNVDYVVHLENKRIKEIIELYGSDAGQIFFEQAGERALASPA